MFSRGKDEPAAPPAQASKPRTARSAPSIISADLVVNGTLTSSGDMQIDGTVEGDIRSLSLTIGEKAIVHGEVVAEEVTIRGKVIGGIRARKVTLASTCHVEGNILHEAFTVEAGAFFEGHCRHSSDPTGDTTKPVEPTRPSLVAAQPQPVAASTVLRSASSNGLAAGPVPVDPMMGGGAKPAAATMQPMSKPVA